MKGKVYILGGGTFSHVRTHLALAAPAFGKFARLFWWQLAANRAFTDRYLPILALTKMADHTSTLVTNEDVSNFLDKILADPETKGIVMSVALCDYRGTITGVPPGKLSDRLETSKGPQAMLMTPTEKLLHKLRTTRKDIFVVGFKTTANYEDGHSYYKGLELLKKNSLNLVVANDIFRKRNQIIVPEESHYMAPDRDALTLGLMDIMLARMGNHFTRSTVLTSGMGTYAWNEVVIPPELRTVVDFCVENGAYKPFLGKTAGHFATKVTDNILLTSIRKANYNEPIRLVRIEARNNDEVWAWGAKPSVGGQSQRKIFAAHPDLRNIVHFHCQPKSTVYNPLPVASQWQFQCGSHECGENTASHMGRIELGGGYYLKGVHLQNHGPNIGFPPKTDPAFVINFLKAHYDFTKSSSGYEQSVEFR